MQKINGAFLIAGRSKNHPWHVWKPRKLSSRNANKQLVQLTNGAVARPEAENNFSLSKPRAHFEVGIGRPKKMIT
jgi:hypothetical protein